MTRVSEFDFDLPEARIALQPARPRDSARLLHVRKSAIDDRIVRDLPGLLRPGDLLVLNDTRVIPAQLRGVRPARAEGGSAKPVVVDATLIKRLDPSRWRALARPAKRLKAGDRLRFGASSNVRLAGALDATVESKGDDGSVVLAFDFSGAELDRAVNETGVPPLPPYIARKRPLRPEDQADYQTVYAKTAGSVAAPTAGLHFTDDLFDALDARGIERIAITLHVGAGTFLPVTADDTRDHTMHPEWGEVTAAQCVRINAAKADGRRIVAVGTTTLRLLESAADAAGAVRPFLGDTAIFITPGHRFRVVNALMTNFHLPRSTLFMLACAFAGSDQMKAAYAHAIAASYRFYSYGDACLLERCQ
ncbi:MAG: tRNA preQ1(34) S-adenosylmethionine ribosyltransferase-isomerase QueA [Parvularculaceae bacterium]